MRIQLTLISLVATALVCSSSKVDAQSEHPGVYNCLPWVWQPGDMESIFASDEYAIEVHYKDLEDQGLTLDREFLASAFPNAEFEGSVQVRMRFSNHPLQSPIFNNPDLYVIANVTYLNKKKKVVGSAESFISAYSPLFASMLLLDQDLWQLGLSCIYAEPEKADK